MGKVGGGGNTAMGGVTICQYRTIPYRGKIQYRIIGKCQRKPIIERPK